MHNCEGCSNYIRYVCVWFVVCVCGVCVCGVCVWPVWCVRACVWNIMKWRVVNKMGVINLGVNKVSLF